MKKYLTVFVMFLVLIFLTSCSTAETNIGFIGTNRDGLISYQYLSFNGQEQQTSEFDEGQNVQVDFEAVVKKGNLIFMLISPSGDILWEVNTDQNLSETVDVSIPENGFYKFIVDGDQSKGSFKLTWN